MVWVELLNDGDVLECLVDFSHLEGAPSKVLVDLIIALVSDDGCLIFSDGLDVVLLFLIEHSNLYKSICLSLQSEGTGKD